MLAIDIGECNSCEACLVSKGLQGRLLFLFDLEELVEFGDLENFVNLRVDITQDQPSADRLQLLIQRNQLAERRA
jgi:hypothetical protein